MNTRTMRRSTSSLFLAVALLSLFPGLASSARAACMTTPAANRLMMPKTQFSAAPAAAGAPDDRGQPGNPTGMWHAVFLIGDGPARFDETFQTIHTDGTEMMISNGVPPRAGNVCAGIWKQMGREVKVRHMTWNWDMDTFAGTFVMIVTMTVDRRSNTYDGRWVADSYDVNGVVIPEAHFEGVVHADRINMD